MITVELAAISEGGFEDGLLRLEVADDAEYEEAELGICATVGACQAGMIVVVVESAVTLVEDDTATKLEDVDVNVAAEPELNDEDADGANDSIETLVDAALIAAEEDITVEVCDEELPDLPPELEVEGLLDEVESLAEVVLFDVDVENGNAIRT